MLFLFVLGMAHLGLYIRVEQIKVCSQGTANINSSRETPVVECGVTLYFNKNQETLDSKDPLPAFSLLLA